MKNEIDAVLQSIAGIESEGRYSALSAPSKNGDRAYGKYQVMGNNIPSWSKEALGKEITPEEFLKSPELQEKVVSHKIGQYLKKYTPEETARVWFAGEGGMNNMNAKDVYGTTVAEYSQRFQEKFNVQLPDYTAQALKQTGYDPDEYTRKINLAFDKGRTDPEYWKAAKSYNDNIDATMPPLNRAQKKFLQAAEQAPVNQVQLSWWDDVGNSFGNALTNSLAHIKLAGAGINRGLGITDETQFANRIEEVQKQQQFQTLRLSPEAVKDPLSFNEDGSFNWRGLGSTIGNGLGGLVGFAIPALASLGADLLTGTPLPTIALLGMNGLIGAVDVYGSAFEEGKKRGLTNDQAATLGVTVGVPSGLLFSLPITHLGSKLMKPATLALSDAGIESALKEGLTNKAFQDSMQRSANGLVNALTSRGANYLRAAGENALAFGSTMFLQSYVTNTAEKLYANYSGTQDKFQDVFDKTAKQQFVDAVESGVIGGILGSIVSFPAIAKPMMEQTTYGYVDKHVGTPKIEELKNYITELGFQKNYTQEQINILTQSVDEMATVASTYGKSVKNPEARFQIFNLLRQDNMNKGAVQDATVEVQKLTEGTNPAFSAPIAEKWGEVQALYTEKQALIDKYLAEVGDTRNPIRYDKYVTQAKEINGRIREKLAEIYPDKAEFDAKTEQLALPAPEKLVALMPNSQNAVQMAQRGQETEEIKVKDLLDVPVVVENMKGFLTEEDGNLIMHNSENGKEHVIATGEEAKEILESDANSIDSIIQDYDRDIAEPKESNEYEYAKSEIEKGVLNWDGNRLSPRINLEGIEWREIRQGEKDILRGKDSKSARRLRDALETAKEQGGYEYIEGSGELTRKTFVPFEEKLAELKEEVPTEQEVEQLANEYDQLTPEQQQQIEEVYGTDEGAKSTPDADVQATDELVREARRGTYQSFKAKHPEYTQEQYRKLLTRRETGGTGRISEATANLVQQTLKKAFGGIKVNMLSGEEYAGKHGDSNAVTNPDGTVDINLGKVTSSTQVHEFGHIWTSWAKKYRPELYKRGMDLVKNEKKLLERVQENYDLEGAQLYDEALNTLIGERGAELVDNMPTGIKKWISDLWENIKSYLNKRLGRDTFADVENMSLGEFTAKIAKELLRGQEISPITSEEIAAIEVDGISRYQLKNEDFRPPADMVTLQMGNMSTRGATADFIRDVKEVVGQGEVSDNHVLQLLDRTNKVVKELIPELTKNPDGTENIRAGAEYVLELRDELASKKTTKLLREIGENVSKGFDPETLSKDAKKLYQTIGRVFVHAERTRDLRDKIVVDANEKVVLGNANEAADATVEPMKPWREKFEQIRDKNAVTKWSADTIEKYVLNTSDLPLFFKSLTGSGAPMWNSLARSFKKAAGKEFSIRNRALEYLKPLSDKFKKGSVMLGTEFSKTEGVNTKEYFGGFSPEIKVTEAELAGLYLTLRQPEVRAIAFGENGMEEFKASFREYPDRPQVDLDVTKAGWEKLQDHFKDTGIEEHVNQSMNYLHGQESPVFNMLTGLILPKREGYYPLIPFEGKDTPNTYMKRNKSIDDISSHRSRTPSGDTRYYIGDMFEVLNNRATAGSKYAAFAVPIHNGDVMMNVYSAPFFKEHGMKKQQEYWNKWKYHFSNPEDSIGELEKKLTRGFVYSAIGLNPFVNLKNIASIPMAANVIRAKYLTATTPTIARVYAYMAKNHGMLNKPKPIENPTLKEMIEHSDFANMRIHGNTTEAQELSQHGYEINVDTKILGRDIKVKMKGADTLKGLKNSDVAMGAGIWEAAKAQVEAEYNYAKGSEEYWNKVDDIYTDAVTSAQSSIDEVHRSFYSKGGFAETRGTINRVLSLFAGQQFAQFNTFMDRAMNYANNPTPSSRNQFAKAFMNVFMVNALAMATIDTLRQQALGKKQELDKQYMQNLFRSTYGTIPLMAPFIDIVVSKSEGWGHELNYPVLETINQAGAAIASGIKGKDEQAVKESLDFISRMGGVPNFPIRVAKKIAE